MKFLIDECLSPELAKLAQDDTIHVGRYALPRV